MDSSAILNGSLNGNDIADNGIDGDEIFNGSVSDLDIALLTLRTNTGSVTAGSAAVVSVNCLTGETAISVGSNWDGASTVGPVYIAASNLSGSGGAGSRTLTAQVLCLS